jgi:hypothetical protein
MIPVLLQDFLVNTALPKLFDGYKLKNVEGVEVPLNIYSQYLPAKKVRKDTEHFPFIRVILDDGEDPDETEVTTCRILFMIGIYDTDENYQGYKDCLNILQKMYDHFVRYKIFDDKYEIQYPIKWRLHDEDLYPYFFGGLETIWNIGKVTIIDSLI